MPRVDSYFCDRHRVQFFTSEQLNRHLAETHRALDCPICGQRLLNDTSMRLHLKLHKQRNEL